MKEIKYPVSVGQEPEGEPDAETMTVLRDATGRDLDVEEVAAALNAFASSHALQNNAQAARPGQAPSGTAAQRREESVSGASLPSTPVDTSAAASTKQAEGFTQEELEAYEDGRKAAHEVFGDFGQRLKGASAPSTTPRSETPRTAAIARKWSLKGGGTNTSDASPEAKELYGHAEQLEHELRKLAAEYADLKVYGRTTASATRHMDPRPCMAPICGTTCGYPEDHQIHEGSTKPAPPHGRHAYQPSAPTGAET